ncbi:TetR/AcrR family transcriptional regulator [Nostoc sp. UCD121]|uniref:TetR/AcrR family transcriptional regulator n=1 Tax=unclassified Nostoc TaxID=2593658 RepID=UPI001625B2C1|nr:MULTISPECIES: TetR/AcrR family transcriptional regulator [unclassified Nostoc]MBC1223849.1 TetR/AcrR family transcriptional regulator [Nostoc sp. UCD120]MBC1279879.1 TetR/AcrR family transcriptional regulator [Nostoc sp. UCD121]MBC1296650.1 TetR/AcrR family transcriptional regulator [Nostoc sp. UCD122]
MARVPKITNQQILEAARQVFLQQGFGASTLEIAQQAGISEASIFKRFSTKEELFFAAMGIPEKPVWVSELESLSGKGNLKENLINICLQIMEFYREVLPQIVMLRSRGNAFPELGGKEPRPIQDFKALTAFLEYEINQNRLRPCDPQTVAHILLGSLMNYVFLEQISSQKSIKKDILLIKSYLNSEDRGTEVSAFIQNFVDIIWQGIAPIQD